MDEALKNFTVNIGRELNELDKTFSSCPKVENSVNNAFKLDINKLEAENLEKKTVRQPVPSNPYPFDPAQIISQGTDGSIPVFTPPLVNEETASNPNGINPLDPNQMLFNFDKDIHAKDIHELLLDISNSMKEIKKLLKEITEKNS